MSIEITLRKYDETIRTVSKEFGKYNDAIFNKVPFEEWKGILISRSEKTRELFIANRDAVNELKNEISRELTDQEMGLLYSYVYDIRNELSIQDPPVYAALIKKMIAHFEKKQDYPKLSYLYRLYWQTYDNYFVKILHDKNSEIVEIAKRTIIMAIKHADALKRKAEEDSNPGYLLNPIIVGINFIGEHSKDAPSQMESVEQCYSDLERYFDLIKGEKILSGGLLNGYMDQLKSRVLCLFSQVIKYHEDELPAFFDFLKKRSISSGDEYVNLMFMFGKRYYTGQQSGQELIDDLQELYFKYVRQLIDMGIKNTAEARELRGKTLGIMYVLMAVTDKSDIDRAQKREIIKSASEEFLKYIFMMPYEDYNLTNSFDDIVIDLFEYNFKYTNNMDEKEKLIIAFLIRRQPITFIHCLMVQKIALLITESLLKTNRDLFEPLRGVRLSNDNESGNYSKEADFDKAVLNYVEKAALYHDLGKCAIGAVINMQTRPLFDSEFAIIKQHPEKSIEVLHDDPDYDIYLDVMLGHHKTYDGKGGYPASFDNTKSPYRIIIDIVSLADSIDAATDILGRNYTKGKNFNAVFEEFIDGSGKRYNGHIVSALSKDVDLRNTLSRLTGFGRLEIYYRAYHHVEDTVKKQNRKHRKKISARARMYIVLTTFLLVAGGSILAFHFVRSESNRETITKHNEGYLSDATLLLSDYVNNTLYDASRKLESLTGVLNKMYTTDPNQDIKVYLEIFNDGTVFDQVDYVSKDGIFHSLSGDSNCKNTDWFKNAIKGETGYTYVERMPITGKPTILFYEPLEDKGEIVGALVGQYNKIRVKEILNSQFLGIYPESMIIDNTGNLIVSSSESALYSKSNGVMGDLKRREYISGSYDKLREFLVEDSADSMVLKYKEPDGVSIMSVSRIARSDWFVIQFFPARLNASMTVELNRFNVASTVTIIFVVLISFTLVVLLSYRQREGLANAVKLATSEKEKLIISLKDANARAFEAASDAGAASRAKSEFLASMSHELRTPMNAVIGMTDVMLREEHSDEDTGYLLNIKSSGQALLQIINDILDLSKIEAGKMDIIDQEYDMLSLLGDLSMMFWNRIGDKNIELLYDIDPSIPKTLIGDSARVRQILINIVNNAIKFTDEGYIKVSVQIEKDSMYSDSELSGAPVDEESERSKGMLPGTSGERERTVRFSVKDTGIGIKEEDLSKLFGSFERFDQKKNSGVEGTGLGLSITKRLVAMMGGEIHVESIYGQGSDFIFTIRQKISADGLTDGAVIDSENAVNDSCLACISDNVNLLNSIESLTEYYGMTFENNVLSDRTAFIFADAAGYQEQADKIEELRKKGAKLFIVRNPFEKKGNIEGDATIFKPVYSKNFCQCINGKKDDVKQEKEVISFTAPDARILLAEDIEMNVKVALALFAPLKMQIDVAENGQKAYEMVQKEHYDMILMDHMMPVMDGVEATFAIRRLEDDYYKEIPIVALSANVIESVKEAFYTSGMNDIATKPIDIGEICKIFLKWLPADKIIESDGQAEPLQEEAKGQTRPDWFPEELDFELAMKSSYTEEILLDNLKNFYLMIDVKASKIENCLKDNLIKDYTIEVHGLKNSARYIGASDLSKWFEKMEYAGNAGDLDAINQETPGLLTEFRRFKEVLKEFSDSDEGLPLIDKDELTDLMYGIVEAVDAFDTDMVDTCVSELKNYSVSDDLKELKQQLILEAADVKMDAAKETAAKILEIIGA